MQFLYESPVPSLLGRFASRFTGAGTRTVTNFGKWVDIYSWTIGVWYRADNQASVTNSPMLIFLKSGDWHYNSIMIHAGIWGANKYGLYFKVETKRSVINYHLSSIVFRTGIIRFPI